uniref:U-reduvitoxin-Pr9a n=1 Tax=Platymeris rhadamanthus TaxID=1134088 RepID=PR9A_PLARH|nr:RecName: Full=U-reduvitoxin-Pr9a; Short=U-RDTX-Pr9a; AltName: Full=Venom peptide Pr9a; Flags: Precursor [Platymeris rhadamanthus]QHB21533.1 venom peptide Pr9a [Platymeris rhadamanthus]
MRFFSLFTFLVAFIAAALAAPVEIGEDLFALRPTGAKRDIILMMPVCFEGEKLNKDQTKCIKA